MITTFYAVEVSLIKVVADVDIYGATIPGTHSTHEVLRSHYDGTCATEAEAALAFDACEVVLHDHAAQRRTA